MSRKSDDTLMRELCAGAPEALEELYQRYARKLHVYFAVGVAAAAPEDLVHDVFLRVVEAPLKFDPSRGAFRTWLFGIARNLAVDIMRRAGHSRSEVFDEMRAPVEQEEDAAGDVGETNAALRDCLKELKKAEEREALILYYLGGKLFREIGELFGKSTSMAQKLVHAAREKIRVCLERKGVEP
jgi:RNA polymerase sigma-70 factor, ECF subfamily